MSVNNKKKDIQMKVFDFYIKNKDLCDVNFAKAEDENIDSLYYDVTDKDMKNILFARVSTILLTANKYERNILHKRIHELTSKKIQRIEIELFTACQRYKKIYAYWFEWNGHSFLNVHANVTGSYTIGGSADIIRWILSNECLFPKMIISFGVCFGTKESDSKLGDVVISRKVYPYFIGAKINGENLDVVDDNSFSINDDLDNKILNLKNNNKLNRFAFNVEFGNYITGEAVVSSNSFRKKAINITTQHILAGDMEGYGLFKECTNYPYKVPCVIIKSICDWGIEKNFNVNDEKIISTLKTLLINNNVVINSDEEVKTILESLKDRLQAYSANCAFDVLKVFIKNNILKLSILNDLRKWFEDHNGIVTSCRKVREKILKDVELSNLGLMVPDSFVHLCLTILENEGLINRETDCKLNQEKINICTASDKDISIDINKRRPENV